MDRTLKTTVFFLAFFVASTTLTAYAQSATDVSVASLTSVAVKKQKPPHEEKALMKCIYTPATSTSASTTSSVASTLPTVALGFKFSLQKNNNNEIAVDTYTMSDQHQAIKQVGHSELVSSAASSVTSSSKASAIIANLSLAEDSPFEFAISFSDSVQSSTSKFSATVASVVLFNGESYQQVPVSCGIASESNQVNAVVN